ncbi:MAG: hypothetical protein K0S32_2892 [Bacteroidetes bacterium]|nr:hypothetical protein [Bacteroidota bacterium]
MKTTINIREFEYFFGAEIIRKGFSLFKNNRISSIEKKGKGVTVFHFEKPENSIEIKRSGEKISEYSCTCRQLNCVHLCSVVFYFQKELFGDLSLPSKQKARHEGHRLFNENCKTVKEFLVDGMKINDVKNDLVKKTELHLKNHKADAVYFHLAIIHEISSEYSSKFTDTETRLSRLLLHSKNSLREFVKKGLSTNEKTAWVFAAKSSISNYRRFNSKQFVFLIPFASLFIKDKSEVKELQDSLEKKRLSIRFPSEPDLKLLALICLDLSPALKNKKKIQQFPEEYMAHAEMEFCKNRVEKAFKTLKEGFDILEKKKPASFIGYIEFVIEKARTYNDPETETIFLEHLFIYDSYINPSNLLRLKELLNNKQRTVFIDKLVKLLEKKDRDNFNKIAELLLSEKRYNELIQKISKQKNMFRLLNSVMIKKFPDVNENDFSVYVSHFKQTAAAALETHFQELVFNNARVFIDKLPQNLKSKLVRSILAETAKHSYLHSYILKIYPY